MVRRKLHRVIPAVALVLGLFVSGCASPPEDEVARAKARGLGPGLPSDVTDVPVDWAERALPFDPAHRHSDPVAHKGLSTPNFQILGHNPLISDYHGRTSGGYGCSSAVENGDRTLSITASFTTDVALIVSDVTDTSQPEKIGELVLSSTQVYDSALTPDLRFALLATSPYESGPEEAPLDSSAPREPGMFFRDACSGHVRPVLGPEQGAPYAAGLLLVNLENPRNPFIEDFRSLPAQGAHSIRAFHVDGRTILLASVSAAVGATGYWMFLELDATVAGNRMVPLSIFYPPEHATYRSEEGPLSVHDGTIQKHPITGQWLGYLADVFYGGWIINVDDLRNPQAVAFWDPKDVYGRDVIVHGIQPIEGTWDGRHYALIHEENVARPADSPTGWLTLLDTTDPANPKTVSAWTLPVDVQWRGDYQFSLHYTAIVNRTLFVSMYHGGLWAIDATNPEALTTIGVFMPDRESPKPAEAGSNLVVGALLVGLLDNIPVVVDVNALSDGTLITYDANTGLYAVRFDESIAVPSPEPWPTTSLKFG